MISKFLLQIELKSLRVQLSNCSGSLPLYYRLILYCFNLQIPKLIIKFHILDQEVGVIYTHHQKTVIVDADAGNNRRRITAFLGGLDLCNGRYDTPQHHIFRTLQTWHADDYHNPTYAVILLP